jgi:hypothetical protein
MLPYLRPGLPVVFIYNNIESFFDFLSRSELAELPRKPYVPGRQYSKGDRALISLGDRKLVFVSAAVPHADYLQQLHYPNTTYRFPANPSPWLCLDILQEPPLFKQLVEYAGASKRLQLIAYAHTRQFQQLVSRLRDDCGLTILLPESPLPGAEWVRDYIDTKSGFRSLAGRWLPNASLLMPEGIICRTMLQAAEVGAWLCRRGKSCVIKTDGGESGIGQHIFRPGLVDVDHILAELQADPYLYGDLIVVEEYISASNHLSPSLEVFVPQSGAGEPVVTYVSNQLFLGTSDFYGLLISSEQTQAPWYQTLADGGLALARQLQTLGYAGHFDLDTVVDDHDRLYLLELNARRTAGTHVHEFACHFFGPHYRKEVTLLSINKMKTGGITQFADLKRVLQDLLFPIGGKQLGIIFAVTSILAAGEFGCIIVGNSTAEVVAMHQELLGRFHSTGPALE